MKYYKYKIPWHIRQYVKKELIDYPRNIKLIESYTGDTRGLILAHKRLQAIKNVLERLNEDEREATELIFFKQYTQVGAEVAKCISKNQYYYTQNKVIYLVAEELDLL